MFPVGTVSSFPMTCGLLLVGHCNSETSIRTCVFTRCQSGGCHRLTVSGKTRHWGGIYLKHLDVNIAFHLSEKCARPWDFVGAYSHKDSHAKCEWKQNSPVCIASSELQYLFIIAAVLCL